jgi:hypothetical protein
MTTWLDSLIPPLDPATGFWLLLALFVVAVLSAPRQRPSAPPEHDPHAAPYGDVTERPHG